MALLRFCGNNLINALRTSADRSISTTSIAYIKEIKVEKCGKTLEISSEYKTSPREGLVLKEVTEPGKQFCPKCTLGLDVKHTDVLILSQYLRSDGCMLPRRITGLCPVQQRYMGSLVSMAQKAGLMSNINPSWSHKDPKKRHKYKKFNTYFDETTIKYAKRPIVLKYSPISN